MLVLFRSIYLVFIFLAVCLSCSSAVRAQANDGGVQSKAGDPIREAIERRNREIALRSIVMTGPSRRDPREQQALLEQMSDDFKQIQVIRLGMVNNIAAGKPFEYKRLASDASEIKKRATRLRSALALREDNGSDSNELKPVEYGADTIQNAASDLCLEISRFTTNPLFKEGSVYNVRYANEADKTLESIINLSESIKNSADILRRSTH